MKEHLLEFQPQRLVWFVARPVLPPMLVASGIDLFTRCVEEGAHLGGPSSRGICLEEAEIEATHLLLREGLVEHMPEGDRWRLTESALKEAQAWQVLGNPVPVCATRDMPI